MAAPVVLVAGGGFAGHAAVRELRAVLPAACVVHVSDAPHFEFTPSAARCVVEPGKLRRVAFGVAGVLRGRVVRVAHHFAVVDTEGGQVDVAFDFCIWCVGVGYASPIRGAGGGLEARREEFDKCRLELLRAKDVLVVGGGLVGVELAAELAAGLPGDRTRAVTLATSPRGLLPRLPARAARYVEEWLLRHGVRVVKSRLIRGRRAENGRVIYRSEDGGNTIEADVAFVCTGGVANGSAAALLAGGVCSPDGILRDGAVNVLETLQLREAPNIFAAGDASMTPGELDMRGTAGEKTAYAAGEAGILAARNVARLVAEREVPLLRYPVDAFPLGRFPRLFAVSLYKYDGVVCIGPAVLTGLLAALTKYLIEVLGVRSVRQAGLLSSLFQMAERFMYTLSALFSIAAVRLRRPHL